MSPRRIWDSPNPSPARDCAPPLNQRVGGTLACGWGVGESQFRRLEKKLSTLTTVIFVFTWRYDPARPPECQGRHGSSGRRQRPQGTALQRDTQTLFFTFPSYWRWWFIFLNFWGVDQKFTEICSVAQVFYVWKLFKKSNVLLPQQVMSTITYETSTWQIVPLLTFLDPNPKIV